ncbi:hypothetical protein [Primorskyibacter marinus]|uniref:hypothetical protein n=1 Tax=Primorskyibacter marinus TaxID=1977320 RepID=UPI000E2FF925|nr:hypothetical protein [Primorskyibacter marinus]
MRLILALTLASFAGCTSFPELEAAQTPGIQSAAYPRLLPLDTLLTEEGDPRATPEAMGDLAARVARLRARADRLRGPVIDSGTRSRMARGVVEG